MCKEIPVIPVNRVVDTKRIVGIMEDCGGEAQGVAGPKNGDKNTQGSNAGSPNYKVHGP
jgi:hypothetical protein